MSTFYCFVPPSEVKDNTIKITGKNARHLSLVLRAKPKEHVKVRSDRYVYDTVIEKITKKDVLVRILSCEEVLKIKEPYIILCCSLIQEKRFDLILQTVTQLGVYEIKPFFSEHTVYDFKSDKMLRWKRILEESCMQSQNPNIPLISPPCDLKEIIKNESKDPFNLLLFFSELEEKNKVKKELFFGKKRVFIFIGPEGGWSQNELIFAKDYGCVFLTLGPLILRTETAACVALTLILEYTGVI